MLMDGWTVQILIASSVPPIVNHVSPKRYNQRDSVQGNATLSYSTM